VIDDETIKTVKERARLFVLDNFSEPTRSDFLIIETAVLIGVSIALEMEGHEIDTSPSR
jgi:hypothetical protein